MNPTSIPFIDISRTTARVAKPFQKRAASVLDSSYFVSGPFTRKLEEELEQYFSLPHAVGCSSGTSALRVALQAAGVKAGDKVALPNLTFWACFEVVKHLGAEPVLLETDSFAQLELDHLRAAHDRFALDAVIFVHLFGYTSPKLEEIRDFCRENRILLVEDGAQAFGVEKEGVSVLSGADIATLSFYPAKVIGGGSDGGAILARDASIADRCRMLLNHGRSGHYAHTEVGWNARMSDFSAAYLLEVLALKEEILNSRRESLRRYGERLAELSSFSEVRLFEPPEGVDGNGYLCILEVVPEIRERVQKELGSNGVQTAVVYPATIDQQEPARDALRSASLEASRLFVRQVLNLPLFAFMTTDEVDSASDSVLEICRSLPRKAA